MARESIAMTPDELRTFFGAQRWIALATLDPDGTPVADIAPVRLDGDHLCVAVARDSQTHDNIRRNPSVACAADEFPSYYEIRGAIAHGQAEERTINAAADWLEYAIPLTDVTSFDFKKIRNKY